ncbi:DUF4214 domain-containing protein [Marinobacterium sp. AK62]|uniref:DUF4214 domain-containing protein n=1 Tax=Marinobacterium alkalitolerans TaxID=1542925 RepID=A0ABS3ZEJ1_9GAMM|nr:DUF4214 domain-containing protein [Marinobacterium alkalitolerans]MBP0049725.1 DUF4214 domain-containing protein [Marinobacterium alkalitolerans]
MPTVSNEVQISGLYAAFFDRAPDWEGLQNWLAKFATEGATLKTIAAGFAEHEVFQSTYGGMSDTDFVNAIYQNMLGGAGDAQGVQDWVNYLAAGNSRADMVAEFVQSALTIDLDDLLATGRLTQAEYDAAAQRQALITNKATVGYNFANTLREDSNVTSFGLAVEQDPAYLASIKALANVDATAESVEAANAFIVSAALSSNPTGYINNNEPSNAEVVGQTFTLTTGSDVPDSTANNDTYTATDTTLTAGDAINGGEGNDTLNYSVATEGDTNEAAFTMDSVEVLNVTNDSVADGGETGQVTFDLSGTTGLETVRADNSTNSVVFNYIQSLNSDDTNEVEIDNLTNITANAGAYYAAAAVTGTSDTVNLEVNSTAMGTLTVGQISNTAVQTATGIETIAINATGAATTITRLNSDITTLEVTGDQDLTIATALNNNGTVSTIDADTFAGDLTLTTGSEAMDVTVDTGAGDDNITVNSSEDVTANLGEGDNTFVADQADNAVTVDVVTVTSGAGNDDITTGMGNDDVTSGAGDDTVRVGTGTDTVNLGAGNDTVTLGDDLSSDDTVIGGEGEDSLRTSDIADVNDNDGVDGNGDFTNVSEMEELVFTTSTNGTLDAGDDVDAAANSDNLNGSGIHTVTFEDGLNGNALISDVTEVTTVNLEDASGSNLDGNDDFEINRLTDGTEDAINVNVLLNGGFDASFNNMTLDDYETINLDVTDSDTSALTGGGANTVTIADLNAADLNDATLNITGNADLTITNLNTTAGQDIAIDATGTTGSVTIENSTIAAGDMTFTAGDIDVSIDAGDDRDFGGDDSITVGTGDHYINAGNGDNVIVAGDNADIADHSEIITGTGDDNITVGNGNGTTAPNGNEGFDIDAGAGADVITSGAGDDIIVAGTGNDTVSAGAGDDRIIAGTGATILEGVDTLDGGAGNDTFEFTYSTVEATQGLTSADTIIGGDGTDTVKITTSLAGETIVDDIFYNWSSVEVLDVSDTTDNAGVTINAIADAAGLTTIVTNAADDSDDTINVGEGFDNALTIQLGDGDDTINAATAPGAIRVEITDGNLTAADNLTAGTSTSDVLAIEANDGVATVDADEFESIVIVDGTDSGLDADLFGDQDTTVILTDGVVNAGQTFVVDATALQDADAGMTLDATAETDGMLDVRGGEGNDVVLGGAGADLIAGNGGNDTLYGYAGNDSITGGEGNDLIKSGAGADTVDGGAGDDIITGGTQADSLTGGEGADFFRYDALEDSNSTNTDTITDFVSGEDKVEILDSILTGALNFAGNAADFGTAQGNTTDGDGQIDYVFQQDNNTLWVDLNDDGTLNADDLQIKLDGVSAIAAGDVEDYAPAADTITINNNSVSPASSLVGTNIVGGDGTSTLTFQGTNDITGNTLVSVEDAVFAGGSDNTLTASQFDGFDSVTYAAGGISLTLTGGTHSFSAADEVDDVTLVGGSSVSLLENADLDVTTSNAGDSLVNTDQDIDGTYDMQGADDTLNLIGSPRDISGATGLETFENLAFNGDLTMTAAQFDGFEDINKNLAGTNDITLTTATTTATIDATNDDAIDSLELAAGTNVVTIEVSSDVDITETGAGETTLDIAGTYTGTFTDSATADKVILQNGANISGATGLETGDATLLGNATMDDAQHDSYQGGTLTATGGANTITITDAVSGTAHAAVESYVFQTSGSFDVTANTDVNLSGAASADIAVTAGGNTISGTYALAGSSDSLIVANGANITGINGGTATTAETLNMSAVEVMDITMTAAQHDAFTTISQNGSDDTITFTATGGDTSVQGRAGIDTYYINGLGSFTFTVGDADQNVEEDSTSTNLIFNNAIAAAYTGNYSEIGETGDVYTFVGGVDVSGATLSENSNVFLSFNDQAQTVTLTRDQHEAHSTLTNTTGVQTIDVDTVGAVTARVGIEAYVIDDAANTLTVNASQTDVNVDSDDVNADTIVVGGLTVTGDYTVDAADTVEVTDGANLTGVNSGGAIAGLLDLTGGVTTTVAQYNAYDTAGITAGGTADSVTLSDAGTVTANDAVESYVLATGVNQITFDGADAVRADQSVQLSTDADTVVITNATVDDGVDASVSITNFGTGDVINTGASDGIFYNNYAGTAAQAVDSGAIIEIDAAEFQAGVPTNTANVLAWLTAAGVTSNTGAGGELATVIAYNGAGSAALYHIENTNAGADAFDTIELIGIVDAADNSFIGANFA